MSDADSQSAALNDGQIKYRAWQNFCRPDGELSTLESLSQIKQFNDDTRKLAIQLEAGSGRQRSPDQITTLREVRKIAALFVEEIDLTLAMLDH